MDASVAVSTVDTTVLGAALHQLTAGLPALLADHGRLTRSLTDVRRAYADLLAAARAALSAQADGESDPWWYLRDELAASQPVPADPDSRPGTRTDRDPGTRTERGGWCL